MTDGNPFQYFQIQLKPDVLLDVCKQQILDDVTLLKRQIHHYESKKTLTPTEQKNYEDDKRYFEAAKVMVEYYCGWVWDDEHEARGLGQKIS
jgi:hypothetical protein